MSKRVSLSERRTQDLRGIDAILGDPAAGEAVAPNFANAARECALR